MKKIILSALFFASISFGVNAQVDHVLEGPAPQNTTFSAMADCDFLVANDQLYGGALNSAKYASKFVVPQNETFQPFQVTMTVGVVNDATYLIDQTTGFKFAIYPDVSNAPGTEITSAIVTPTSATFIQTVTVGTNSWHLFEIVVNLNSLTPIAAGSYFFGLEMTQDDGVQVGLNFTQAATGSITYFDNGAGWSVFNSSAPNNISFTYLLEGDCVLSTASQSLELVSVYPNPTTDILNVQLPSNVEITDAVLYDVLGKNTGAVITNGQINVSNLSRGVYMLSLETTAGTLVKKVVKK